MITVEKGFRCNAEMGNSRLDQDLLLSVVGRVAGQGHACTSECLMFAEFLCLDFGRHEIVQHVLAAFNHRS